MYNLLAPLEGLTIPAIILSSIVTAIFLFGTSFIQSGYASPTSNLTFTGFDKDFTLQYPSNWTIEPKTSRFETMDVKISQYQEGLITVSYYPLPSYVSQSMKEAHVKAKDIESNLDLFFPTYLQSFHKTFTESGGSASEIEEPSYDKYTIDGHKIASAVLAISTSQSTQVGTLVMLGIVGKNFFELTYSAPQDIFDQKLPIAENIIQSIKFLK